MTVAGVRIFEKREDGRSNPEIGSAELVSAQELSSRAVWFEDCQKLWVDRTEQLLTGFGDRTRIIVFTENSFSLNFENINETISKHIAFLCSHWVLGVVTIFEGQVSHQCSGCARFERTILGLQSGQRATRYCTLKVWPVFNWHADIFPWNAGMSEKQSNCLTSAVALEIPDAIYGFRFHCKLLADFHPLHQIVNFNTVVGWIQRIGPLPGNSVLRLGQDGSSSDPLGLVVGELLSKRMPLLQRKGAIFVQVSFLEESLKVLHEGVARGWRLLHLVACRLCQLSLVSFVSQHCHEVAIHVIFAWYVAAVHSILRI